MNMGSEPTPIGVSYRAGKVNIEIDLAYDGCWVGKMTTDNGLRVKGAWPTQAAARVALFAVLPEITVLADSLQALRESLPWPDREASQAHTPPHAMAAS
jgi:hypothetical protein